MQKLHTDCKFTGSHEFNTNPTNNQLISGNLNNNDSNSLTALDSNFYPSDTQYAIQSGQESNPSDDITSRICNSNMNNVNINEMIVTSQLYYADHQESSSNSARQYLSNLLLDPYKELNLWLQLTYELEMKRYREKKSEAEKKLLAARLACKRLNRKRYNILGSVRLLHTDNFDDLENRLINAKAALEQLQMEIQERVTRWNRIETLLGFRIQKNIGFEQLKEQLTWLQEQQGLYTGVKLFGYSDPSEVTHEFGSSSNVESESKRCSLICTNKNEVDKPMNHFMTHHKSTSSDNSSTKAGLPRNYSFIRPFAALWQRKTKMNLGTISKKK